MSSYYYSSSSPYDGPSGSVPQKPDTRVFVSYPMPAKINLLNERPRQEIEIEQQLGTRIKSRSPSRSPTERLSEDFARKEAKLHEEIENLQRRPYSPYELPAKIDLGSERLPPRHVSPVPSRFTNDIQSDLINKEIQLLEEIAELERKPYNPQKILLEHEKWYEYPQGHPEYRQVAEEKRRVKDFCSLPAHLYPDQGAHIHEENLPVSAIGRTSTSPVSSIHTAVINVPNRKIDNRSPLPFSFDNFSTKGVRGNIATVGAVPPERPYPPICHSVRRSRSPIVSQETRR